jgi:signal transduction histidine kinase
LNHAQKEDIELQIQLPDMPLIFHSDPRYLTEAISNLVANGIKYTPVGGTVLITAVQKDKKIIIELKDTGAGINEQHLPRIFDRFYRLPEHRESGIPGTGLGLSITQSIIHQLGGEITVESQLGEGTSFQILLPQK